MARGAAAEGAIILAGGPSSRMGEPKALVEVNGKPMLIRVLESVYESGIDKAILSFKNQHQSELVLSSLGLASAGKGRRQVGGVPLSILMVFDDELSQVRNSAVRGMVGPVVVAMQQGWKTVQLTPCDVPFLDARLPPLLHSKLSRGRNCVLPRSNSGLEPLLMCARTDALSDALTDATLAAHEVVAKMKFVESSPDEWGAVGITDRCFINVNSADDLAFLS